MPPKKSQNKNVKEKDEDTPKLKKQKTRDAIPDVKEINFSLDAKTKDGKSWNFKIASWNINGIRAWLEKNGSSYITEEDPDIFCVQETKCSESEIPSEASVTGYHTYWSSAEKAGYAGTGLYSKIKPLDVTFGLGKKEHDEEGRLITAEFEKFYLLTSYVPNSGRGLPRLEYRTKEWDVDLLEHMNKLKKSKPVILCGDLNVAHEPIDLANPKTNKKTAGYTEQERAGFSHLLAEGYIDSFRHFHPDTENAYSFWSYMGNARSKNVGWRLDYFVVSDNFTSALCDSVIRKDVMGSDHCPIALFLHI